MLPDNAINMFKLLLSLASLLLFIAPTSQASQDPLPADRAFRLHVAQQTPVSITLTWEIAPGYYLYKDRLHVDAAPAEQILVGRLNLPDGIDKHDEILGDHQAYQGQLQIDVPVDIQPYATSDDLSIIVHYQGCADSGYCYPPTSKKISWPETDNIVDMNNVSASAINTPSAGAEPRSRAQEALEDFDIIFIVLTFLGFGLLLAFTPCVLPMLPILSGLILGHGKHLSHGKAFVLASFYVLGMALTYAGLGMLASFAGQQMQSLLQKPWLIIAFSGLFIALALSLLGWYDIRLPTVVQNRLNKLSQQQSAGNFFGVTMMGVLSALLVSPCITPPLVGALTYMGNTGNLWLGGSALFAMGIGMGIPLIVFVTIGSKLLPKSGPWMVHIEQFFAVILFAVAVWLLERVIPAAVIVALWGALLIFIATLLGTFRTVHQHWLAYVAKTAGIIAFTYGVILVVAGGLGQQDPFNPLQRTEQIKVHPFQRIKTLDDFNAALDAAKHKQKPMIIDFYADWCVACKKMDKQVFMNPEISQKIHDCFLAVQADITRVDIDDRKLQQHLSVVAPPTLIFFNADGEELKQFRIIGEMKAKAFLAQLQRITGSQC